MTTATHTLSDVEARALAGEPATRADAGRVADCQDLITIGMLGETLRKAWRGDVVTFGRVLDVASGTPATAIDASGAGEVRLAGAPASIDDARERVRAAAGAAAGAAGDVPVTGFSLADLDRLAGGNARVAAELASALRADGLASLGEVVLDAVDDVDRAIALLGAMAEGGLGAWRATVHRAASLAARLELVERAAALHGATGAFRALAPLPRVDPEDTPSTGYDDVRTVALARLIGRAIPSIQVDWQLYGPKLAQVAIAYGADDLDAVPAIDVPGLGHRRSPREDLERQIRAAFAEPRERTGRYEVRA
jgi:aminodeoxyfutalosine synthase